MGQWHRSARTYWQIILKFEHVLFSASDKQLNEAIKAFKMFNKRAPTPTETTHLKSFLSNDKLAANTVFITPIKTKQTSVSYDLYLDSAKDQTVPQFSSNKQQNIKQFVACQTSAFTAWKELSKSIISQANVASVVQKK
eukprot:971150_1